MKKILSLISLIALLPLSANAITFLGLGIDRSGSIASNDFRLQIDAYKSAIGDTSIIPQDNSIAIGVWSFGSNVKQHFLPAPVNSGNIGDLLSSFDSIISGGNTALASAIQTISTSLLSVAQAGDRKVIDISTDGHDTRGGNPFTASANAISAGIDQVNGLGVGSGANLNFVAGTNAFKIQVDSFADFEAAIKRKLKFESGTSTPPVVGVPGAGSPNKVPDANSTFSLLAISIAGLFFGRKKLSS